MPEADPTAAPYPDAAELPVNDPRGATRRCVRRLFHCRLSPSADGPDLAATVVGVSPVGLLLMASGRLDLGSSAVVRIGGAGPTRLALDLPVRAAQCADKGTGWFAVGAEFVPPPADEAALALLARIS
jgi:hypothetical protein